MIRVFWHQFNSHGQEHFEEYRIHADTKEEIDEILEVEENGRGGTGKFEQIPYDEPEDFGYAGGFFGDFLGALNDNGDEVSDLVRGWYGPPVFKKNVIAGMKRLGFSLEKPK